MEKHTFLDSIHFTNFTEANLCRIRKKKHSFLFSNGRQGVIPLQIKEQKKVNFQKRGIYDKTSKKQHHTYSQKVKCSTKIKWCISWPLNGGKITLMIFWANYITEILTPQPLGFHWIHELCQRTKIVF